MKFRCEAARLLHSSWMGDNGRCRDNVQSLHFRVQILSVCADRSEAKVLLAIPMGPSRTTSPRSFRAIGARVLL